ncbi:hypothetical protein GCM10011613_02320 [Cellvibrio zantedeschiae]|uniref:DUF3014 domain-containing protein n=1 Tax=Cellvibrio zantedeschiae TaxID=1237077 RepID=A0ABQ3AMX9_9GAMM|nr:DUF3014 domain-containing protein [Cellvibrio zantedeschiae]GGY62376.1 hypothetical protein GCM10011613_02320 [Cellvibrio zantedeschiae]
MQYNDRPTGGLSALAKWGVILVAVGAIGTVGYFLMAEEAKRPPKLHDLPSPAPIQPGVAPEVASTAKPVYDEPEPAPAPIPLPDLDQSDAAVLAALKALNINGLVEMIIPQEILRKFVRAVGILEEGKVITEYRPIASPQGAFVADSFNVKVSGGELGEQQDVEQFRVSPKNYLRYTMFVQVISALDSDASIALYKRYYPLLNRAYQELGLGKGNFHSVLIRAIDKVLAAPDAGGEMLLIHPKVYYQFADPALENLPDAHKLMLRMGPDNAAKVKESLRNIRIKLLKK